ncbi:MAG: hypothetical protein HN356_13660, partial [Calditrichaeota bacterium]|nr:hypothetical protein [Calditrichota bacterium]
MKLAIITLIIIATVAYSQPEIEGQRHYGDDHYDYFTSHIRCEDGGWAFCGAHHDNGEQEDFWLVRTDMEGEIRYLDLYGDGNKEWAYDLAETEDGGFVIGGYVYTPPTSSYFIVRVDNNGEEVWSRTYGEFESDQCRAVLGI